MRRVAAALCLTSVLAGCAISRAPIADRRAPLHGTLSRTLDRGYLVSVNRPAYIAIFEVIPGVGASIVYPALFDDERGELLSGSMFAWEPPVVTGRWLYQNVLRRPTDPRYILLIASEEPLALDRIGPHASGVRRLLERKLYVALNPYDVMEGLARELIPEQPEHGWSTDLLVQWPGFEPGTAPAIPTFAGIRYLMVRCANGREIIVPRDYPFQGCPGDQVSDSAKAPPVDSGRADGGTKGEGVRGFKAPSAASDRGPARRGLPASADGGRWAGARGSEPSASRGADTEAAARPGSAPTGRGFREGGADRANGNPH